MASYSDTFGGSGSINGSWSVKHGTWTEATGGVGATTDAEFNLVQYNADLATDRYLVEVKIVGVNTYAGPAVLVQDASNYVTFGGGGGNCYLRSVVAGSQNFLATLGDYAINDVIGLEVKETSPNMVRVFKNGTMILDWTSTGTSYSCRRGGMWQYYGGSPTMDNFSVADSVDPPPPPPDYPTTIADGFLDDPTTWYGGTLPATNEPIIALQHDNTLRTHLKIGDYPAAGNTVLIGTGTLRWAAGGKLTLCGDATQHGGALLSAGCAGEIEFDSSGAESPEDTSYEWHIGTQHGDTAYADLNGVDFDANTFKIYSNPGGAPGRFAYDGLRNCGHVSGEFMEWTNLGDADHPCVKPFSYDEFAKPTRLSWTRWSGCGTADWSLLHDDVAADFSDINFSGSTGIGATGPLSAAFSSDGTSKTLKRFVFDQPIDMHGSNWIIGDDEGDDDILAAGDGGILAGLNELPGSVNNKLNGCVNVIPGIQLLYHGSANTYCVFPGSDAGGGGVHWIGCSYEHHPEVEHIRVFFDAPNVVSGDHGDCFFPSNMKARRCMVLPNRNGDIHSVAWTNGDSLFPSEFSHNNFQQGGQVGEVEETGTGAIAKLIDNIFSRPSGSSETIYKIHDLGEADSDVVAAANAHHNSSFGGGTGLKGKAYDVPMDGTPGANDIDGEDPGYVDPRNILDWDSSLGGDGSIENVLLELRRIATPDHKPAYSIVALQAFAMAGQVATNEHYRGTASDGGDRGAVPMADPVVPDADPPVHRTSSTIAKTLSSLILGELDRRQSRGQGTFWQGSGSTRSYNIGQTLKLVGGKYLPADGAVCDAVLIQQLPDVATAADKLNVALLIGGPAEINQDELEFDSGADASDQLAQIAALLSRRIRCARQPAATNRGGE